jgi:riboflavin kinase/FMN adenylyltransferase
MEKTGYALALGTFDGLHLGHQSVLTAALEFKNLIPVAVTFDEPPKRHTEGGFIPMLISAKQKNETLKKMGFSAVDVLDYKEIHHIEAEDFLDFLFKKYNVKAVVCGFNYRFGNGGKGDVALLSDYCKRHCAEAVICPAADVSGKTVSSTFLRNLIASGDISFANSLLLSPFSFTTEVIHGEKRGRTLGFPTVNQPLDKNLVTPKLGVYASVCEINSKEYPSVTNIGIRPTFILKKPQSETHILDFDSDLYGQKITVKLLKYLREETRFQNISDLKNAIENNAAEARKCFAEYKTIKKV